jgi:hypothetical protein
MNPIGRGLRVLLALSASLLLFGCGTNNTYVRSVNASPGLGDNVNYSVQAGVTVIASSLPYGTEGVQPQGQYPVTDSSGNYRAIGAGSGQQVLVFQTPGTPLKAIKSDLLKNSYYTIVNLGPAPGISLMTLADGDTAPSGSNFKLRLVQTSAMSVDVYITPQGATLGGATPIVSNFQFGQVTQQYLQIPSGPLEVQVTPHGDSSKVIYTGTFTANGGDIYTGYFLDPPAPGSTTYGFLLVKDPVLTPTTSK